MNIFKAAQNNDLTMINDHLKDINLVNNDGHNALMIACSYEQESMVNELLSKGAHITLINKEWAQKNIDTQASKMIFTAIAADDFLANGKFEQLGSAYNELFYSRILYFLNQDQNPSQYEIFKSYCKDNPIEFTSNTLSEIDELKESFDDNGDSWRYRIF